MNDFDAMALFGGPTKKAANGFDAIDLWKFGGSSVSAPAASAADSGGWNFADAFTPGNMGTSLQGIGSIIGAIGGIWGSMNQQKAYDRAYEMEAKRIADLKANHDRTQKAFSDVWG
ncbi:hypothetical protein [Hydrogenimonas sp.]